MKKYLFFIAVSFFTINYADFSYANPQYDPVQLRQFSQNNKCISCDLSGAMLYYGSIMNHSKCDLNGSDMSAASGGSMIFTGCNFSNTRDSSAGFNQSDFSSANFEYAVLIGSNLSFSIFENADFDGAVVMNGDCTGADLFRSNITPAQLATAKSICGAILPDGNKGKC